MAALVAGDGRRGLAKEGARTRYRGVRHLPQRAQQPAAARLHVPQRAQRRDPAGSLAAGERGAAGGGARDRLEGAPAEEQPQRVAQEAVQQPGPVLRNPSKRNSITCCASHLPTEWRLVLRML